MPDLNRFVRKVSDSLGTAATPERVESISRLLLDELVLSSQSPRNHRIADPVPVSRVVFTADGPVGIDSEAALAEIISGLGGRVDDVSRNEGEGRVSIIMYTTLPESGLNVTDLQSRVDAIGASIGAHAGVLHEELFRAINSP